MPTYEYECGACGHHFERFQPITSKPIRQCPGCGLRRARRLLGSGGAVIFKGSGFYATDHRSASYKEGAKNDKPAPAAEPSAGCDACKKDLKSCPKAKEKD